MSKRLHHLMYSPWRLSILHLGAILLWLALGDGLLHAFGILPSAWLSGVLLTLSSGIFFALVHRQAAQLASVYTDLTLKEECFHAAIDHFPDLYVIYDGEGRFVYINARGEALFGRSCEQVAGLRDQDLFPDSTTSGYLPWLKSALQQGRPHGGECHIDYPNGCSIDAEFRFVPLTDQDGQVRQVLGIARDTGEHQRSRERLRQASLVIEGSPSILFRWDAAPGYPILYVSGNVARLGYNAETLVSSHFPYLEMLHPDDKDQVLGQINRALQNGEQNYRLEYRLLTVDGDVRRVVEDTSVEYDDAGQAQALQGVVQDVTRDWQAEEERRLTAKAFASTADGIIITDAQQKVIYVNRAFTHVTGYSREEIVGQRPVLLRSGRHNREFYDAMWHSLREQGMWQGELWNRRKNGEIYPEWLTISAVSDDAQQTTHFVGVFTDISKRKQDEAYLTFLANHDPLTGLYNRARMGDLLNNALPKARDFQQLLGLVMIDIDRFRTVNDSLGHGQGDHLLQAIAQRLSAQLRPGDHLGRLGGDEFLILLEGLYQTKEALHFAERISGAISEPFTVDEHTLFLTASIGVSCFPLDGQDAQTLLKNVDTATNRAKERGPGTCLFFSPDMAEQASSMLKLGSSLRRAIECGEFELYYQPRFDLRTQQVNSVEALLRWNHPEHGVVTPKHFIQFAEETGMIEPIGEWVVQRACYQLREWQDAGLPLQRVGVNLSMRQFQQADLAERIHSALASSGLAPDSLEIELTESVVMQGLDATLDTLNQLKALGVKVSIDDFGTGYSSLSYLKRLPIDYLKIDRSFIAGIPDDAKDVALTQAIIGLARRLQFKVIAEGVEYAEQQAFLLTENCDEAQGYWFSPPLPVGQLLRFLEAQTVI